jgi:hypothetical protein
MLSLQSHHIVDLYTWVDDVVPQPARPKGGRPPVLRDSEVVTILVWNSLTVTQKTLKGIYDWVVRDQALPEDAQVRSVCRPLSATTTYPHLAVVATTLNQCAPAPHGLDQATGLPGPPRQAKQGSP